MDKITKLTIFTIFTVLALTIWCATVEAEIVTPPTINDSALVLRFPFDENYTSPAIYSWENNWQGWSHGSDTDEIAELSTNWASSGSYSVRLYAIDTTGSSDNAYIYKTFPTMANLSLRVDINITKMDASYTFKILINDNVVYSQTSTGEFTVNLSASDVTSIKFLLDDGNVGANSEGEVYIDNLRFLAIDSSGNNNDGVVHGATWTTGGYGYALSFDGDDFVKVADSASLESNNITIAMWFKRTANDATMMLLDHEYYPSNQGYSLFFRSDNKLYFRVGDGTTRYEVPTNPITDTDWHFGVFVANGSYIKAYLDGEFIAQTAYSGTIADASVGLFLGRDDGDSGASLFFYGYEDEVRIYANWTPTDAEVKAMYEALRVHIKDETDQSTISNANVTLYNETTSISVPVDSVTHDAVLFHADISAGEYYLSVDAPNYYERKLIETINDNQLTEDTAWLPSTSETVVINTFKLKDLTGEFDNAQLIIKKPISGDLETIYQNYFDFNDEARAYLIYNDLYQLYISNGEEVRSFGWFQPSESGTIEITVSPLEAGQLVQQNIKFDYSTELINETYGRLTVNWETLLGNTTYVSLYVNNSTATYYFAESTEESGKFVVDLPNDVYTFTLYIQNDKGDLKFTQIIVFGKDEEQVIPIPLWLGDLLFGGLALVVIYMGTKTSMPFAMAVSTIILGFSVYGRLSDFPEQVVWVMIFLTGISWLRGKGKEVES
ncbi:hypothetical protein DRP07_00710 [Archaeoglobales archaeon]|nr:MAG: hypothetical protein DRP07_00710 [Archaeoglobales archaeon]